MKTILLTLCLIFTIVISTHASINAKVWPPGTEQHLNYNYAVENSNFNISVEQNVQPVVYSYTCTETVMTVSDNSYQVVPAAVINNPLPGYAKFPEVTSRSGVINNSMSDNNINAAITLNKLYQETGYSCWC